MADTTINRPYRIPMTQFSCAGNDEISISLPSGTKWFMVGCNANMKEIDIANVTTSGVVTLGATTVSGSGVSLDVSGRNVIKVTNTTQYFYFIHLMNLADDQVPTLIT